MKKFHIYKMWDEKEGLLYVGKTSDMKQRLNWHKNMHDWSTLISRVEKAECLCKTDMDIYNKYYVNLLSPIHNTHPLSGKPTITLPELVFTSHDLDEMRIPSLHQNKNSLRKAKIGDLFCQAKDIRLTEEDTITLRSFTIKDHKIPISISRLLQNVQLLVIQSHLFELRVDPDKRGCICYHEWMYQDILKNSPDFDWSQFKPNRYISSSDWEKILSRIEELGITQKYSDDVNDPWEPEPQPRPPFTPITPYRELPPLPKSIAVSVNLKTYKTCALNVIKGNGMPTSTVYWNEPEYVGKNGECSKDNRLSLLHINEKYYFFFSQIAQLVHEVIPLNAAKRINFLIVSGLLNKDSILVLVDKRCISEKLVSHCTDSILETDIFPDSTQIGTASEMIKFCDYFISKATYKDKYSPVQIQIVRDWFIKNLNVLENANFETVN